MAELNNEVVSHRMTPQQMAEFMECEKSKGASANMLRRYRAAIESVYSFLPEDKLLTKEVLLSWREQMEEKGYAPLTVQNYAKNFNRFLDFAGCSDIRFNRGRMKDIRGMEFGFLTAIKPTDKRNRKDVVWICRCRCGKIVELPATRLLTNNTLSCGCILKEHRNAQIHQGREQQQHRSHGCLLRSEKGQLPSGDHAAREAPLSWTV